MLKTPNIKNGGGTDSCLGDGKRKDPDQMANEHDCRAQGEEEDSDNRLWPLLTRQRKWRWKIRSHLFPDHRGNRRTRLWVECWAMMYHFIFFD